MHFRVNLNAHDVRVGTSALCDDGEADVWAINSVPSTWNVWACAPPFNPRAVVVSP